MLLLLSAMGGLVNLRAVDAELRGPWGRLRAAAIPLASGISAEEVAEVVRGGEL